MKTFGEGVKEAIGFYVYRLIDPRDDVTFYVGNRGVGVVDECRVTWNPLGI